jgi:hypothetical protein
MSDNPLRSLDHYSRFITELLNRKTVVGSTITVWSTSPYTGTAEGEVIFKNGLRLRIREELDYDAALITSYGYEVYQGNENCIGMTIFPILKI